VLAAVVVGAVDELGAKELDVSLALVRPIDEVLFEFI